MKKLFGFILLVLVFACDPVPDSTGRIYTIDPDKARKQLYKSLDEIIEDNEEHHEAYFRRSLMRFQDEAFKEAYADIQLALKYDEKNQEYIKQRILILFKMQRFETVLRLSEKLDKEHFNSELKKVKLIAEIRTGKLKNPDLIDDSIEDLGISKSLEIFLRGLSAWKRKDTLQAKSYLVKAHEMGEASKDLFMNLTEIFPADSIQHEYYLKLGAKKYPTKAFRMKLASYYEKVGEVNKQDSVYDQLLIKAPDDFEVRLRKAQLKLDNRKYLETIDLLRTSYLGSKSLEDDRCIADAYFALRRNDSAMVIYRELLSDDTTGQVNRNLRIINWRFDQAKKMNDSLSTIAKDSVNSNP